MDGEPNRALGHVVRVARGCYRALVAFGSMWLPLPEDQVRRILYGEDEGEEHGPRTGPTTAVTTAPPTPARGTAPAATPTPVPARNTARMPRLSAGPPPGHPERLCVEVPLSELELRLARQLRGV